MYSARYMPAHIRVWQCFVSALSVPFESSWTHVACQPFLSAHELFAPWTGSTMNSFKYAWPVALAMTFGGITMPTSMCMHIWYMSQVT